MPLSFLRPMPGLRDLLWPRGLKRRHPEWSDRRRRAVGAYWGLAVGDALGATVEFMTPAEIRVVHDVHREMIGGGWLRLKPGAVTDDTTMSLALGEAILESGGTVSAHAAAVAFDGWMKRKPVDIGNTVRRGILHFRRTGEPLAPANDHDAGNGACMRLLPAVLATLHLPPEATREAVLAQARVTHNHPLSDAACRCVADMLRMIFDGASVPELMKGPLATLLLDFPEFKYRTLKPVTNPSGFIVDTLRVVIQGVVDSDNYEDALIAVVNRGGDADTTGAIAGMIAGAMHGPESIPSRWLKKLDPEVRDACQEQALALVGKGDGTP